MVQIFKLSSNSLQNFSLLLTLSCSTQNSEHTSKGQTKPKIHGLFTRQESQHCIAIMMSSHVTESVVCARG